MATRTSFRPQSVITNGDMSLASITSLPTILQSLTVGSYSYSWAGVAPVGTVAIQVSNDYSLDAKGAVLNAGTWTTIVVFYNGAFVSTVPVNGNNGTGLIDWSTGAYAIRTVYTKTGGTGTLQAVINGKVA